MLDQKVQDRAGVGCSACFILVVFFFLVPLSFVAPAEKVTLPSSCSIMSLALIVPIFLMRILHSPVMISLY